jgi:hypothetical protein
MSLVQVTKNALNGKRLKPLSSYGFLQKVPVCEIVVGEFGGVAANYPIFFVDRDGSFVPIALFALRSDENLYVEANGVWTGHYLPAALRRYPFTVGPGMVEGKEAAVLMVEEDMLSDTEGEPLFAAEEKDEPNSPVGRAIRLIAETDRQVAATRTLVAEIAKAGLIEPAAMNVQQGVQQQTVGGLCSVNEKKLLDLPDNVFLELRRSGALNLIYMQLVSLGQIARLQFRDNLRRTARQQGESGTFPLD